jgi:hypothetical protein
LKPKAVRKTSALFSIPVTDIEPQRKLIDQGFVGLWLSREAGLLNYVLFENNLAFQALSKSLLL